VAASGLNTAAIPELVDIGKGLTKEALPLQKAIIFILL
jgi:hypothetical protein